MLIYHCGWNINDEDEDSTPTLPTLQNISPRIIDWKVEVSHCGCLRTSLQLQSIMGEDSCCVGYYYTCTRTREREPPPPTHGGGDGDHPFSLIHFCQRSVLCHRRIFSGHHHHPTHIILIITLVDKESRIPSHQQCLYATINHES